MNIIVFLFGAHFAFFGAAGLFFLKFWRASQDRFYLSFSIACFILSVERIVILSIKGASTAIPTATMESNSWVYIIRLIAFLFILMAIVNKNRGFDRT